MKRCNGCKILKPYASFSKDKSRGDGHQYRCKTCATASTKKWKKNNPEKVEQHRKLETSEVRRARYLRNHDKNLEAQHRYRQANPEKRRAGNQRREARKRQLPSEDFLDLEIFERDGWVCQICYDPVPKDLDDRYHPMYPNLDHIVPISYTGDDNPGHVRTNVRLTHRICNLRKSDKLETTNR